MKKRIVWLITLAAALGLHASAEVVISSPTGTPDESDVALEKAVGAVKELPSDAVKVIADVVDYAGDEFRNTAHGVKSVFKGDTPREAVRDDMLTDVDTAWDISDEVLLRSYNITPAVMGEMVSEDLPAGEVVNVSSFCEGIDFPEGAGAYLWPDSKRLMVRSTRSGLLQVESALSQYHRAEEDYKQVEVNAKFIEVSQSTLNQLGFTWNILDTEGFTGARLFDDWQIDAPQDIMAAGIRTAAGAFGAGIPGAGSMVLTKSGWMPLSLTIDALEQASDSDVLSSPSITTKDGKTAQIWVGEDRMVPGSFEVNSQEVNVHVQHNDWDSQLMGVHFSVSPEILKENIIRLELKPKIVDLIGYDHYQVSPEASMMMINGASPSTYRAVGRYPILNAPGAGVSKAWNLMKESLEPLYGGEFSDPNYLHNDGQLVNLSSDRDPDAYVNQSGEPVDKQWSASSPSVGYFNQHHRPEHEEFGTPLAANYGSLPYFRVREIETTVNVADGSTVGLGGLIYDRLETYKDKVPVLGSIPLLGRLFRSEGERSIKRNLMIFVTATQVADSGQRKADLVSK